MGHNARTRAQIARLGSAQSALLEAAEELQAGGEPDLAAEVTALGKKLNATLSKTRAVGPNNQRWDNHG